MNLDLVGKRLKNLNGLPKELLEELQCTKIDPLESEIIDAIHIMQGAANVDEILVGLYRATRQIHPRKFIANKLFRMSRDGLIQTVKGRRGIYALVQGDKLL